MRAVYRVIVTLVLVLLVASPHSSASASGECSNWPVVVEFVNLVPSPMIIGGKGALIVTVRNLDHSRTHAFMLMADVFDHGHLVFRAWIGESAYFIEAGGEMNIVAETIIVPGPPRFSWLQIGVFGTDGACFDYGQGDGTPLVFEHRCPSR